MGKVTVLIVILMLGVLALFAVYNNDPTAIFVPFDQSYEIPKIGVILFSSVFGAACMLLLFAIRDTRRFLFTYQYQKKQKNEEKIHSLYTQALNAILAEDEAEARAALSAILKKEPGHTDAHLRLGDIEANKGRDEEAYGHYKRAHASSPEHLEALFSLARIMEKMQGWDEALGYVENILDLDPDNLSALHMKRSILEREGRWDELIEVQKAILRLLREERDKEREEANLKGFRYELARDSLEKGDLEKALKAFKTLVREDEKFTPAHLGVAETMLAGGDTEEAVSYLERAYESTSSQIILARLEDLLISLEEPSRLIRIYRKALSARPRDEALKFFLGKLYFRLEMIEDAFDVLASLDTAETWPDLHKLLGELHMRRDECGKAVEQFRKTIELGGSMRLPYCCGVCGHEDRQWSGRCPECGSWNSYRFELQGACRV
jgi:lipopolysaccharide biosynthesis regulator YciM